MAFSPLRGALAASGAVLGFYAVSGLAAQALGFVLPPRIGAGAEGLLFAASLRLVLGALAAGLWWALAGWRSWRAQGWPPPGPAMVGFGRGTAIGLGMAGLVMGAIVVGGAARVTTTGEPVGDYLTAATRVGGVLAVAALGEELLFRGLPLARAAEVAGPLPATIALTLGFTALHLPNPGVTVLGLVNVALASLVLSAAFVRLGGMPAAWGVHLGWNAGLALGADAPVSGMAFRLPGLAYASGSANWLSGGTFGPEGGLAASLVMAVAAAALWGPWARRAHREGTEVEA